MEGEGERSRGEREREGLGALPRASKPSFEVPMCMFESRQSLSCRKPSIEVQQEDMVVEKVKGACATSVRERAFPFSLFLDPRSRFPPVGH